MTAVAAFASPMDASRWGEYRRPSTRPVVFAGRITEPVAGRYHLYGSWSCPASHRLAVIRQLAGLTDVVSLSYVDERRDGRGWAFREATGTDPVNGFTLLREAYLATDPDHDGPVTVPVLWDRATASILSTDAATIGIDLATRFGDDALRPAALVAEIDAVSVRIADEVESQLGCAVYRPTAATALRRTLTAFDTLLATRAFLVGDVLTDADVRLWVQLVRYDAGPNAHGAIGPRLDTFEHLWAWARRLYALEAFRTTTDLVRISAPLADLPPW